MRKGINPEKAKEQRNVLKLHRVIIPVYIPNSEEEYYKESLEVLDLCLYSLIKTINPETTVITLVDNNSASPIENITKKYREKIDKLVTYQENKGKIYAVLNEARNAFEPFITIADADVLFFSGWEKEISELFRIYPRAGIISPLPTPNNSLYHNYSLFFDLYLRGRIGYDKIVASEDLGLYEKGLNYSKILDRPGSKYSWREKQFYLKGEKSALVGASHFVATYRSHLFHNEKTFPEFKFRLGYEERFLDDIADRKGYYRLSSMNTFAYHIGNRLDEIAERYKPQLIRSNHLFSFSEKENLPTTSKIPYFARKTFFKILKSLKIV